MSVDFPEPFCPMSAWISPGAIRRPTESSTLAVPKVLLAFCTSSLRSCRTGSTGSGGLIEYGIDLRHLAAQFGAHPPDRVRQVIGGDGHLGHQDLVGDVLHQL